MRTIVGAMFLLAIAVICWTMHAKHQRKIEARDDFAVRFMPPTFHKNADGTLEIHMKKLTKEQRNWP